MGFKAEDFEKKMGECPKHGKQVMWLACKHVSKQTPNEIWLGPNRVAICPACSMLPVPSIEEELLVVCESCIKNKITDLLKKLDEKEDAGEKVRGLDVYREELQIPA
jgi:hypothetical protein